MKILTSVLFLSLAGCVLQPTAVRTELEHLSHATQHAPFTDHPTNYGVDVLQIVGRWEFGGAYLELGEGAVLEKCQSMSCGGLAGPRETFTGRVGYEWRTKP